MTYDIGEQNLGMRPTLTVPAELEHPYRGNIELKLTVPEQPSLRDVAASYLRTAEIEADVAEESVLDAELALANAQRIAQAAHDKAARLRARADELKAQLDKISGGVN